MGIRDVAMVIRGAGCIGVVGASCGYSGIGGSVKWVRRSMVIRVYRLWCIGIVCAEEWGYAMLCGIVWCCVV